MLLLKQSSNEFLINIFGLGSERCTLPNVAKWQCDCLLSCMQWIFFSWILCSSARSQHITHMYIRIGLLMFIIEFALLQHSACDVCNVFYTCNALLYNNVGSIIQNCKIKHLWLAGAHSHSNLHAQVSSSSSSSFRISFRQCLC